MSILLDATAKYEKRNFDPASRQDLLAYYEFNKNNCWRPNCPFTLEVPYTNVPAMIRDKIIEHHLGNLAGVGH